MEKWKKTYLKFVAATVIQAGIFVAYRLWIDQKNKSGLKTGARVDPVELDKFKPETPKLLIELGFNDQFDAKTMLNLQTQNSPEHPDSLDIQPLMYRRVFVSIQKYKETRRGLYGIYVDFGGLFAERILPSEFLSAFLKDAALSRVPVVKDYAQELDEEFFHYVLLKDMPQDRDITATEFYEEAKESAEAVDTNSVSSPASEEAEREVRDMMATRFKQKEEEEASQRAIKKPLRTKSSAKLQVAPGTTENETPQSEVADLKALEDLSDIKDVGL